MISVHYNALHSAPCNIIHHLRRFAHLPICIACRLTLLSYKQQCKSSHMIHFKTVCHILTYRWLRFRHIHCKSNGDLINILFRFRSYRSNSLILSITETQRDFQFARSTIAYCMHIKLAHAIVLSRSLARQVKSDLHIPTIPLWNSEYLYDLNLGNFTQKS